MDQELYELCLKMNNEEVIDASFFKKCEPIENWIDETIESIKRELTKKYNNDPKYKNLDIGNKGYLYFEEQINLFFKAMQAEEHKEIYIHKNSYNAICSSLTKAISIEYKLTKKIKEPNSLLKLNLFNIYSSWYEANKTINTLVLTEKKFSNILKKHNVTLEQITNINWIIENRGTKEAVFSDIYKRNKKALKPTIKKRELEVISYPIDKLNTWVWNCFDESFRQGNNLLNLEVGISRKNPEMYVVFNVDFSNLENVKISDKKLTPYEKRVYFTISNLFNSYQEITDITLDDIGKLIYNSKKISKDQREKLLNAVKKLKDINIKIDNEEAIKCGYNMPKFKYEGRLLPVDIFTTEYKGQEIIKIVRLTAVTYKVSPLFDYMIDVVGQYVTVKSEVLRIPITVNNKNIALSDYLLSIIKWHSKEKKFCVSLKSIYTNTGITEEIYNQENKLKNLKRDQKAMLIDTQELLDYWKTQNLFKSYLINEKGITIHNF